jgi:uncharacterized beta-barrel protein YwiB (DUF1934 family)
MKKHVVLSIQGKQSYAGQEPEVIELVTDGTLEELCTGCWELRYEESALTGMEGVTTSFLVEPERIILTRSGKLSSQMIFKEGVAHDSLYQMNFGALMITVTAQRISYELSADGGVVDLSYSIEIEHSAAGTIDYHLEIKTK